MLVTPLFTRRPKPGLFTKPPPLKSCAYLLGRQACLHLCLSHLYPLAGTPTNNFIRAAPDRGTFCRFAGRHCLTDTVASNSLLCCLAAFCKPQRMAGPGRQGITPNTLISGGTASACSRLCSSSLRWTLPFLKCSTDRQAGHHALYAQHRHSSAARGHRAQAAGGEWADLRRR